ncbi:type I 3-dehydroquinate dehydratase [Lentibacillus sp. Marseille-P4043]|uniref:type I 3-dehydroquinate dehydratase n=1 Tax=Lentibacillus sp. Marseille-P4043 TaxID=2040293 RepID=UPI000D0B8334|nr:type I 3-dehydroquinate dehydratase [Lentibacillus sp. Marseille-P4043]
METTFFSDKKVPYICTPLTGTNKEEIMDELKTIIPKKPDVIEWRADFLEEISNTAYVLSVAKEIAAVIDVPLLFTIRSEKEGGQEISLSEEEKVELLSQICESSAVDLIDFEVSNSPEHIHRLRKQSKENKKQLILSYHNFTCTPANSEMMKQVYMAEFFGADIAKIAVMPNNKEDVLQLLELTKQADEALSIPIVSMSMGKIGSLTRIIGWAYGSVMTFGMGVQSSAPGQIPIEKLKEQIASTQEMVGDWE